MKHFDVTYCVTWDGGKCAESAYKLNSVTVDAIFAAKSRSDCFAKVHDDLTALYGETGTGNINGLITISVREVTI